jgi:hypothetical protein
VKWHDTSIGAQNDRQLKKPAEILNKLADLLNKAAMR